MKLLIQGGVGGGGGEGRGKEDEEEYRRRRAKMLRDGLCTILYHNDDNKYGRSVIVRGGGDLDDAVILAKLTPVGKEE